MARTSQRSNTERFRYGICLNDDCPKCKGKEVQQIPMRKEFICGECGSELRECPPPKKHNKNSLIIIGILVVVIVGIALLLHLRGKSEPLTLTLSKTQMDMTVGGVDTIVATILPEDVEYTIQFQSSDENVAIVSTMGIVRALAEGEAKITATVLPKKGDSVMQTTMVSVIPVAEAIDTMGTDTIPLDTAIEVTMVSQIDTKSAKSNEKTKQSPKMTTSSGKLSLSYGNYSGSIKNGYAHGQGRLVYTTHRMINRNDPKRRTANFGDYVIGEFYNGFVVYGKHYDSSGNLLESLTFGVGPEDGFESK